MLVIGVGDGIGVDSVGCLLFVDGVNIDVGCWLLVLGSRFGRCCLLSGGGGDVTVMT